MKRDRSLEHSDLSGLLDPESPKLVFLSGKGGCGKSSSSAALATIFANLDQNTLLVSTDPAHNLRDVFPEIEFQTPGNITVVRDCLHVLEIDPTSTLENSLEGESSAVISELKNFVRDMPGIDEGIALANLNQHAEKYDRVVIDTAPTGHTLRLMSLPKVLGAAIDKLSGMEVKLGGLFSRLTGSEDEAGKMRDRLASYKEQLEKLADLFCDPKRSTFIVVCIAEYLSVFEGARLIKELRAKSIDCRHVLVNMLLPSSFMSLKASLEGMDQLPATIRAACSLSCSRAHIQNKYLCELEDALDSDKEYSIVRLPLLDQEPRGYEALSSFAANMLEPNPELFGNNDNTTAIDAEIQKSLKQALGSGAQANSSAKSSESAAKMPPAEVQMQIMGLLASPGGIQKLLAHPAVKDARKEAQMDALFSDLESKGMFGGLAHLGNPAVRDGLATLLPKVQDLFAK